MYAKWKKIDPKSYMLYDSIYLSFWNKQTKKTMEKVVIRVEGWGSL